MNKLNFKLSLVQEFLCQAIRHIDYIDKVWLQENYKKIPDKDLFNYAKLNGVDSIVGHSLMSVIGEELPKHWRQSYNFVNKRITEYMSELDRISSILDREQVPIIALKNSGITRGLYPHYGSCPMGDIDILVSKKVFRKAHRILLDNDYTFKFRSKLEKEDLDEAEISGGAEYSVSLGSGEHLWFELQWRPVAGRWIQPHQEPSADELLNRSKEIPGSKARILSAEDNLLQVSLHTAKHSYVRAPGFRLHTDVDRIVRSESIDWDAFSAKVKSLKLKTSVYFSLEMARSLLDTPMPVEVLQQLRPNGLKVWLIKNWLEKVNIFEPDARKWGRLSYIIFVCLLFDSFSDLFSGILPSSEEMTKKYNIQNKRLIPLYHVKRVINLIFKRTLG